MATTIDAFLAAVLLYAAASKVGRLRDFASALHEFGIRQHTLELARSIVALEASLAAMLVLGVARPMTQILSAGTFLSFAVVVAAAWRMGRKGPCMCFGSSSDRIGPKTLLKDVALFILAVAAIVLTPESIAPVAAVLVGVGLFALILVIDGGRVVIGWLRPAMAR